MHIYTPEEEAFIQDNVKGISNKELTNRFNAYFGLKIGVNQMAAYKKNHKLSSGLTGHFPKGRVPFNKGKKGGGWEPTQFKKGHIPANYRPVGSERINVDGYTEVKIADPNKWRLKHIVVWEQHNGPLPKGFAVIFGDGDKQNFELDNLILVSRRQLLTLNRNSLIQNNAEATRTAIIIADIFHKISERRKEC